MCAQSKHDASREPLAKREKQGTKANSHPEVIKENTVQNLGEKKPSFNLAQSSATLIKSQIPVYSKIKNIAMELP